ncbi:MurR/RpiR family transcriptional regulator [Collinsella sp. AF20-14LB]|uniref:MurR/RpiR family transcriptional regulator n=1 Tax=Collinsella sp. AF20-14LB TaxID=2292221 RepID=UPI001F19E409|nr:hypothetical protein [Collinsella sp. AF20-14LB]
MDIKRKISEAQGLTPTEQQLGISALAMGENVRGLSIKEFAACANVSVASVHRFCKKLGLEGFKDLKVELIRLTTEAGNRRDVDINFPFDVTSTPAQVMERMEGLYQTTLAETQELLDPTQLDQAAKLVMRAGTVDIYTGSHNLYPARMFRDRLLSSGKAPHATATSRHRCARLSPRIQTARRSLSPTAALRPTSRKSCRSSAAGMSRSSSSARHTARAFTPALLPTLR